MALAERTYGSLAFDKARTLWQMTDAPPNIAIRLKQLFPRIPKHQSATFEFADTTFHRADLHWFCERYPMVMTSADRSRLNAGNKAFKQFQIELESIFMPGFKSETPAGLREGQVIRPYQMQTVELLRRRSSLLLGDDLGLGKTYQAAAFMLLAEAQPAAVVVQTHLPTQWLGKLTEFTSLRVHLIKGTKPYSLPEADVYIFRYSQLVGWVDVFATGAFKTVVYDEVQELRTGDASAKGSAALVLSGQAQYRLGLSATPIYNYGGEIWNILRAIDSNILGSWGDFGREWMDNNGRVADPEALGTYLREQHVFLRRTKREVGQDMPAINKIIEIVGTDEAALEKIADLAASLALKVTTGSFMERGTAGRELDMLARQATGVGKARYVAAYVRILLDSGLPVLLVGWHRDVYDIWLEELKDFQPMMYTGSESPAAKEVAIKTFIEGKSNLLIMSLRSGAGVDGLQKRCSTVVFGELDWSPKVHEQLIGRLDREGQQEPVTAIYLNSEDGSDPSIVEVLGLKASQSTGIVDPGRLFEPVHSDVSRIKLLAEQFLKKPRPILNNK